MLYRPGSPEELDIIGPPVARRPATEAATVAVLGGKLDQLTAIVEAFEPSSALVAVPTPVPDARPEVVAEKPEYTPEQLAKLDLAEFRAVSAARWAGVHDHLAGGSPYSRAYGTPSPLAPFRGDGS